VSYRPSYYLNLDANASCRVTDSVLTKIKEVERIFPNASAVHQDGQRAKYYLEWSRASVRELLNLSKDERIVFTSGATESNNQVLLSPVFEHLFGDSKPIEDSVLVIGATEHPSVSDVARRWINKPFSYKIVAAGKDKGVSEESLREALSPDTRLVSLMTANNETGEIFPIAELVKIVRNNAHQAYIHTDCVQGVGKLDIDFQHLGVDYLTFSSHKLGGLIGVGVVVVKKSAPFEPLLLGGGQEGRLRAGTENLVACVGLGQVCLDLIRNGGELREQMSYAKSYLLTKLTNNLQDLRVNFSDRATLANTLSLTVPRTNSQDLVVALDLAGIGISAGSACSSGKPHGSSILQSLGFNAEEVRSTVRLSLSGRESLTELDYVAKAFTDCALRAARPCV
jgi:cysteine desulfurase